MNADVHLAIVGSGFGGSLLAMIARRLGLRVALLERGTHPRFAIGESASPLAGVLIEQLADRYDLPRLEPLASYGAWQRTYPDVVCGLKRGFTYFKHEDHTPYFSRADRANQLLVAASPDDEVSDTHWLRADVDHFLVREAIELGVEYLDLVTLEGLEPQPSGGFRLTGHREGRTLSLRTRVIVDASGPRGFLSRALGIDAPGFRGYPATQALFSHFTGVGRCEDMPEYDWSGEPPYPPDAAALHHVLDEGWMWVLRFDNGVTSAGVAVTDRLAQELRAGDGADAWTRLMARYPTIRAQFAGAEPIREFTWMPRIAYRAAAASGPGWAMLPSAAGFVDPLFSSGIPMTLTGIERIAASLERWTPNGTGFPDWGDYGARTLAEADHTARFVAGCYAGFREFDPFVAYSMFYFVAASFSEMTRRLGSTSRGFLCEADAAFASDVERLSPASAAGANLEPLVREATERLNVAGLCDPSKRNWYGVDLEDTVRGAAKLGVSQERVRAMLAALLGARVSGA